MEISLESGKSTRQCILCLILASTVSQQLELNPHTVASIDITASGLLRTPASRQSPFLNSMNGQFVRLTPAPEMELHENGKPFAQFDSKTVYLVEGADPIVLGRASSRDTKRINDPDNGYLKVPTGQTALGREHALLCVRNNIVSDAQFGSRSRNHARHSCILL
jgi:hypothetical protein